MTSQLGPRFRLFVQFMTAVVDPTVFYTITTFSLQEQNLRFIATYVVYGRYYTRIIVTNQGNALVSHADPWQFVFEDFALAQGHCSCMDCVSLLSATGTTMDSQC